MNLAEDCAKSVTDRRGLNMLRKLPGFLTACILILTPLVASALGFGNIKLNSALNEPLEIGRASCRERV